MKKKTVTATIKTARPVKDSSDDEEEEVAAEAKKQSNSTKECGAT